MVNYKYIRREAQLGELVGTQGSRGSRLETWVVQSRKC